MIDVNYLEKLVKTSQTRKKIEDPMKEITQIGLQSSCTIYVKHGKGGQNQWSGSGFHIGNGMIVTASHVVPPEIQNLSIVRKGLIQEQLKIYEWQIRDLFF
jgi:S1-C subfamily serine protease